MHAAMLGVDESPMQGQVRHMGVLLVGSELDRTLHITLIDASRKV
jgi:hypothetical protein